MFWLFADSIELKLGGRSLGMRYDPPNDYGCDRHDPRHLCMGDYLMIATAAGLTVEEQTSGSGGSGGGKGATIYARFCFNPLLGARAQNQMGEKWLAIKKAFDVSLASPKCGSLWDPTKVAEKTQADTLNFSVGPYQFKIVPRSAFGVFEFLGTLMKANGRMPSRTRTRIYLPTATKSPNRRCYPRFTMMRTS